MPRKNCCCNIVPPVVGSCCRPIYNGCIGKTYEFSFQFSVKYPCTKSNGSPMIYKCDNNNSITYDIPGNFETYEITCLYTIERPAELRGSPACISTDTCGSWACQGSGFDPNSPSTWKQCENLPTFPPVYTIPCTKCDCYTSLNYSYCNFNADKLKTSCNCKTGLIPWIWDCGYIPYESYYTNVTTPCGTDGFGNPRPFTVIQEGNEKLLDLWSACYRFYEIKQNDFGFTNFGDCGCTFDPGSKNLLDSYNVQFIPNPSIPEQNNPNYQPRIIIDLINFEFQCTQDGGGAFNNFPPPGYDISFSLGIGYIQDFKCGGTTNNPVIEQLYIPFQICNDTIFGGSYYDGLYIEGRFNRSSFTTDPFDLCIPPSTTSFVKNNSGGRCTSEIFYSDSYTNYYENSSIGNGGILYRNDTGIIDCPIKMGDVCDTNQWDPSIPDSIYCNFLRFTNKILVSEV